jgi:hypothetical protein
MLASLYSNRRMVDPRVREDYASLNFLCLLLIGSWVSGEPQLGFIPHKGVLSPAEKVLYVSYANGVGPYDGTNGTVHKYDISKGVWTDISPIPMSSVNYGYGGLSVDLLKPGTLMVAALNSWWPDEYASYLQFLYLCSES